MAPRFAFLAATLTTLGVTARARAEQLREKNRNEDGLTTLEYAIIGGVVVVLAVSLTVLVTSAYNKYSKGIK